MTQMIHKQIYKDAYAERLDHYGTLMSLGGANHE